MTFAPIDPDLDPEELDIDADTKGDLSESDLSDCGATTKEKARLQSLAKLQSTTSPPEPAVGRSSFDNGSLMNKLGAPDGERPKAQAKIKRRQKANGPDAVIILKEEKVVFLSALASRLSFSPLSRLTPSTTSSSSCTLSASYFHVLLGPS